MQHYARIDGGVVVEVIELPDDLLPGIDIFTPEFAVDLVVCSADVQQGWIHDGGELSDPPPPPAPTAAELLAYVADRRWRAEQAGTIWNSWPIHTDDRSQGKYLSELQAIALNVRIDGDPWKFADGVFRPISNAEFQQLAIAAREHVRTCFGIEAAVLAQIAAGAITTMAEVDAAFAAPEGP